MRILETSVFTALLSLGACAPESSEPTPSSSEHTQAQPLMGKLLRASQPVKGQYIVVLAEPRAGLLAERVSVSAQRLVSRHGGSIFHTYEHAVRGFAVRMSEEQARALSADPAVKYVEEDGWAQGSTTQTSATWGLDRIDQTDLPLNSNYNYFNTGAGVNVYVIDSGIRITHTEFGTRATNAFTSIDDNNDGINDMNPCHWHGTHVAATVGGSTWGVAKGVNLHSVRVLDCNNEGTWAAIIAGVDWVTANRVLPAVANMSIGGGTNQAVDDAVRASMAAGVVYAISAGNDNVNACNRSPARVGEALTIGATTSTDAKASFSNFGPCIDLFAPGQGITSAWNTGDTDIGNANGTSMAAPHVAGAAALYLQFNPTAPPEITNAALIWRASLSKVSGLNTTTANRLLYSTPVAYQHPVGSIIASHSLLCLDMNDASTTAGTHVLQWHCNGDTNQSFQRILLPNGYYQIVANHSGMCLDVYDASTNAGAAVIQYPCNGDTNQQFSLSHQGNGLYRIIARHSGMCLDVYDASRVAGASVVQYHCNGDFNQLFKLN